MAINTLPLIPLTTLRRLSENRVAMSDFNYDERSRNLAETENLESLKTWELKKHLRYFTTIRSKPEVVMVGFMRDTCNERIELLRAEIHHRRSRKPSWVAIVSLIVAVAGLALGIHNCSRPSSTPSEARPTPMATPQQSAPSATGTPSQ